MQRWLHGYSSVYSLQNRSYINYSIHRVLVIRHANIPYNVGMTSEEQNDSDCKNVINIVTGDNYYKCIVVSFCDC